MKIILLLNKDIHSATALGMLLNEFARHQIKIYLSKGVGNSRDVTGGLLKMKELESEGFEESYQSSLSTLNCSSRLVSDINSEETLKEIGDFDPDLIISIRFGQILKGKIIKLAKHGVINLHSGILPQYRGIMATFWAILNGEKEIGTTLHYIEDERIDEGEIIAISRQEVDLNNSLLANISSLYQSGCLDIADFLNQIEGKNKPKVSNKKLTEVGNYYSHPKKEDLEKFSDIIKLF